MWTVDIENIAGIHSGTATLEPGLNAVQATNWQGKTSLVTAVRTVLGGSVGPDTVTDGAATGQATLTADDGSTHRVDLRREADGVVREGDPYSRTRRTGTARTCLPSWTAATRFGRRSRPAGT